MIICKTIESLHQQLSSLKYQPNNIGFVPTMGALHQGHISLIALSKKQTQTTICSIFVNPTQFNDPKDFEKYPITIEQDILELELAGCDFLFLPSQQEMYPNGTVSEKKYPLEFLDTVLEAAFRPGHFQGVCQVVERLFEIVQHDKLFLGEKDLQQCLVVKKAIEILGKQNEIELIIAPTLREPSGLAMSSRNRRLSETDKENATAIYKCMQEMKKNLSSKSITDLEQEAKMHLQKNGFDKIDYISVCNATTLEAITKWNGTDKVVVLIAAFLNGIRLIDNMRIDGLNN